MGSRGGNVSRPSRSFGLAWALFVVAAMPVARPSLAQSDCSVLGQNTFVRDTLREFYLWYRELPDLDPALFDSPEAYLEALRFQPLDRGFSHIASREQTEAFFSDSQFVGIGFGMKQTGPTQLRISQVFPASPASEAGLARGDDLLEINGRAVAELLDAGGALCWTAEGQRHRFEPLRLEGKEAVSLTNSTAFMLSVACLLVHDVEQLLGHSDVAAALTLEALMCEPAAFDARLHRLRNQEGQQRVAENIRLLTQGSCRMSPEAREAFYRAAIERELKERLQEAEVRKTVRDYKLRFEFEPNRVQDAYSLRCIPQVHGACRDAVEYFKSIVLRELDAVTDNPVIFLDAAGGFEAISGGNFHGEPLALALDFLAIALAELGSISERRVFRLLCPQMSFGLPRNLAGAAPGVNSGLMLTQYTAAQLVSENKGLAHPASVDSIPTSENQEDHVSMGWIAARKARRIWRNVEHLVAIEMLAATQALHLSTAEPSASLERYPLGRGTGAAFDFLRGYREGGPEPPFGLMREDAFLHAKMRAMAELVHRGALLEHVNAALERPLN